MIQARIFQKICVNDRGDVFMVRDVFSKDDEGNRHISHEENAEVFRIDLAEALCCGQEGEVRNLQECLQRDAAFRECLEGLEADDLQICIAGAVSDQGEDQGNGISAQDADDERDHADVRIAVGACQHRCEQGDDSAEDRDVGLGTGSAADLQIRDGAAGQRETDDRDSRTDDYRRHEAVNPAGSGCLDRNGQDYIDQAGEYCTDDETCIACLQADCAGEGGGHRTDKCKGRAQEYRTLFLGEQNISQCAEACSKQCCSSGHAVADNHRNGDGSCHDRKYLLKGIDDELGKCWFVVDAVGQFHEILPFFLVLSADHVMKKHGLRSRKAVYILKLFRMYLQSLAASRDLP